MAILAGGIAGFFTWNPVLGRGTKSPQKPSIESTFATVRLRTTKTKGCLSRMTALTMVFKLCQSASKKWRRLDGSHQIADIIQGVKFKDGEKLTERAA